MLGPDAVRRTFTTNATPEFAWSVLLDPATWESANHIYDRIHWTQRGEWKSGTRFKADIHWPHILTVEHVLLAVEPPHRIGWLVYGLGVIIERWTTIKSDNHGVTVILTEAGLTGEPLVELSSEVRDLLQRYTDSFYPALIARCEKLWRERRSQ